MPVDLTWLEKLRHATRQQYKDEHARAERELHRALYLMQYWERALLAIDQLSFEVDRVVEAPAPPPADALPGEPGSL